ncbi:MAG TPA: tyrosine-type recombinase/integrase [Vicinamibacterales bacterium]|nr:tyrosine-type recombinase/integrase [Vicinamibacterales bacterium]
MARHRNGGLRKICGCPRTRWPKCSHGWYVNFQWDGTHYRFSLDRQLGRHIESKTEAKSEADRLRSAIREGGHRGGHPSEIAPGDLTLEAYSAKFLEGYSKARGKVTWREDDMILAQIAAFEIDGQRLGDKRLSAATEDDFEAFMRDLKTKGRAASTRNHYVQVIKAMFKWAVRKKYLANNPISGDSDIRREKIARRQRRLQGDEEDRLLAAANPRLQRLIVAALETGCRRKELLTLQWKDVDLGAGALRIQAEHAKDREARPIPISSRLAGVLEMGRTDPAGAPLGPLAYVFGNEVGDPIGSPQTAWENACRKAGIADLRFHDLRHEAGSRFLEGRMPLHHVREMLGHASLSTTNTYLNVTGHDLRESMRRLDKERECCKVVASSGEHDQRLPCNEEVPRPGKRLTH